MKFHQAAIIVILISMISLSATTYLVALGESHSATADFKGLENVQTDIINTSNRMTNIYNEFQDDFTLEGKDVNILTVVYKMVQFGWESLKAMLFSWNILLDFVGILNNAASSLGLPGWLYTGVIGMIVTLVVAMLVYTFIKWKVGD